MQWMHLEPNSVLDLKRQDNKYPVTLVYQNVEEDGEKHVHPEQHEHGIKCNVTSKIYTNV